MLYPPISLIMQFNKWLKRGVLVGKLSLNNEPSGSYSGNRIETMYIAKLA
jgi:hypothetical protein